MEHPRCKRGRDGASKYTIQENIASFKKFYTFLYEKVEVSKNELNEMKELIKEEKADWIEERLKITEII